MLPLKLTFLRTILDSLCRLNPFPLNSTLLYTVDPFIFRDSSANSIDDNITYLEVIVIPASEIETFRVRRSLLSQ